MISVNLKMRYTFRNTYLSPSQLFLDPRNQRLFVDENDFLCSQKEDYSNPILQGKIEEILKTKKEHQLDKLILSIKLKGFQPFSDIYVYPYVGNKFIVFEGNRRTTAIKHLLKADQYDDLDERVQESLDVVPVKVLECDNNDEREEIIEEILSTIHLTPPQQWGALQQAFALHQKYTKLLAKEFFGSKIFRKDAGCIKQLADGEGRVSKDVEPDLKVYQVYKLLRENDYIVDGNMYSIIKEVLGRPKLANDFFEFDNRTWQIPSSGLDKLFRMCLCDDRPVTDPKLVGVLQKCTKNKRFDILQKLLDRDIDIKTAKKEVDRISGSVEYYSDLDKIEKLFARLKFKCDPSEGERRIIETIFKHVENLKKSIGYGFYEKKGKIEANEGLMTEIRGQDFFYEAHDLKSILPKDQIISLKVEDDSKYDIFVFDGDEQIYDAEGELFANPFVFRSPAEGELSVYITTNKSRDTGEYILKCEW